MWSTIAVTVTVNDDRIELEVSDDGVGIAESSDSIGSGHVGLAIVRRRVRDAGGSFDSARLDAGSRNRLDQVSARLRREQPRRVRIVGYTDSKGSDDYNLRLSRRRAEAVRAALVRSLASEAPAFDVRGRGEAAPVAPNTKADGSDNPRGRARNRRVEIIFPRAG